MRASGAFRIDQPLPGERVPGGEILQRSIPLVLPQRSPIIYMELDGTGAAIDTHVPVYFRVTWAGKITAWTLIADAAGDVEIDIWRSSYPAIPTSIDTITNGSSPSLSSEQTRRVINPAWVTGFLAGDVFAFNLVSAATITWCILELETEFA